MVIPEQFLQLVPASGVSSQIVSKLFMPGYATDGVDGAAQIVLAVARDIESIK
jgi:hypothetical protein